MAFVDKKKKEEKVTLLILNVTIWTHNEMVNECQI